MLAIDLDGTLFDSRGGISPGNHEALRRADDEGLTVALCTGRGLAEARHAVERIGHAGPAVLATGAQVAEPASGRILHRAALDPSLASEVVHHLDDGHHAVLVLLDPAATGRDYLIVGDGQLSANTQWWLSSIGAEVEQIDRLPDGHLDHALRIGLAGAGASMPPIERSVSQRFGERVAVQHFDAVKAGDEDVHVLEVFAGGVNKWSGLLRLAEDRGIEPKEIAAIGDHINDRPMVEGAGCGIAMGNAVDSLRSVADRRTLTNDDDGVAYAIDRVLSGDW